MREELKPCPLHHHDRHPWAQPGDAPNRAWMMRFADPDMRTMIWLDEHAEQDAREAYAKYSSSWNVYLFATVEARSNPPQEERSDPLGLAAADDNHDLERLRVAARHPKDPTGWKVHNPHFLDWLSEDVGPENIAYLRALIARPARSPGYAADDNHKALVEALAEMLRLADMGFEAAMAEPEEHGCYVAYTKAKAALAAFQSRQEEK